MRKIILAAVSLWTLTGCASTFTALTDRSITSDRLSRPHDRVKINGYSGDRRLAYVFRLNDEKGAEAKERWLICRESFAGALASRSGSSAVTVATHASGSDSVTEALTKVDERAAAVRLYEDQAADLCYARAAGQVGSLDYFKRLTEMQDAAFRAVSKPTESSSSSSSSSAPPATAPDFKKLAADKKAADDALAEACKKNSTAPECKKS